MCDVWLVKQMRYRPTVQLTNQPTNWKMGKASYWWALLLKKYCSFDKCESFIPIKLEPYCPGPPPFMTATLHQKDPLSTFQRLIIGLVSSLASFKSSKLAMMVRYKLLIHVLSLPNFGSLWNQYFSTNLHKIHEENEAFFVFFKMAPGATFHLLLFKSDNLRKSKG